MYNRFFNSILYLILGYIFFKYTRLTIAMSKIKEWNQKMIISRELKTNSLEIWNIEIPNLKGKII